MYVCLRNQLLVNYLNGIQKYRYQRPTQTLTSTELILDRSIDVYTSIKHCVHACMRVCTRVHKTCRHRWYPE